MDSLALLLSVISTHIGSTTFKQLFVITQTLLCMNGRVTMLGISRWADKGGSYRTVQRFFSTPINWASLHIAIIKHNIKPGALLIAGDATVVSKSGNKTFGINRFFSSLHSKAIKGLSFQCLSLINVETGQSWPVMIEQIQRLKKDKSENENKPVKRGRGRPKGSRNKNKTQIALNTELLQLQKMLLKLKQLFSKTHQALYFVYDGALGNNSGIQMVLQNEMHIISKLKHNAALFLSHNKPYSGRGAPKKYGAKIDFKNLPSRYLKSTESDKDYVTDYYQMTALSKSIASKLNIVIIKKTNRHSGKTAHIILFSTDPLLGLDKIVAYYKLRFQIEFNFRDAKQFWGLEDFMVIKETKVHNATNLAFWMVNISQALLAKSDLQGVNDLKSHCAGIKYAQEVFKLLPQNTLQINKEEIIEHLSALGRINDLKKAA